MFNFRGIFLNFIYSVNYFIQTKIENFILVSILTCYYSELICLEEANYTEFLSPGILKLSDAFDKFLSASDEIFEPIFENIVVNFSRL